MALLNLGGRFISRDFGHTFLIDTLAKQTSWLEVRYILARHANGVASLRVSAGSGHPISETNATESSNLDSIPCDESSAHVIEHRIH